MSRGARAILEIQSGRLASRKAVIAPGGVVCVGRTAPSDVVVPFDRQMSSVHFELSWDGARGRLRDRGSQKGTWLDGRQVSEGDVENGAWIRAGDTLFLVHAEDATAAGLPPDSPELAARKARALLALRAEPAPLFAVLDAAREPRILRRLRTSAEEHRSLYEGTRGAALANVAPYLVSLPKDAALLERLVREGWEQSWGVYLTSPRPFNEVRQHLRRLLMVTLERTQRRLYFRFYDPRVLRAFLPTCDVRQADEMFGDIGCFLMEGERGEVLRFDAKAARGGAGAALSRS